MNKLLAGVFLALVGCSSQPIIPWCEKQTCNVEGCYCIVDASVPDSGSDATLDAKVETSVLGDGNPCDPGYFYCAGLDSCIATDNCCTTSDCDAAYTCVNYGCVPTISLPQPDAGNPCGGPCADGLVCQVFCNGEAFCVESNPASTGCPENTVCQHCSGAPNVCCKFGTNCCGD
jgi:hypothetical protein